VNNLNFVVVLEMQSSSNTSEFEVGNYFLTSFITYSTAQKFYFQGLKLLCCSSNGLLQWSCKKHYKLHDVKEY